MEATHKLIVHALITIDKRYLILQRTNISYGKNNVFPKFWDLPGGLVEKHETPAQALYREVLEETQLNIAISYIIHEDSTFDTQKNIVFTRLVYVCSLREPIVSIKLNAEEHTHYKLITSLSELSNESPVPYLISIFKRLEHS